MTIFNVVMSYTDEAWQLLGRDLMVISRRRARVQYCSCTARERERDIPMTRCAGTYNIGWRCRRPRRDRATRSYDCRWRSASSADDGRRRRHRHDGDKWSVGRETDQPWTTWHASMRNAPNHRRHVTPRFHACAATTTDIAARRTTDVTSVTSSLTSSRDR